LQPCRLLPTPYLPILKKYPSRKRFNNRCLQESVEVGNVCTKRLRRRFVFHGFAG
jgi:hypothetical protein